MDIRDAMTRMNARLDLRDKRLEAQVKAHNRAATRGLELYAALTAIFRPLVGKQVCKAYRERINCSASNGLLAKVNALLPKLENTPSLMIYRYSSPYSLVWIVKACEQEGDDVCEYREVSVRIGELNGLVLEKICDCPDLRDDYSVAEIKAAREEVKAAQKALDEAKAKMNPFGE